MIAQPLVITHEFSDFVWKLFALPLAFLPAGLLAPGFRSRRLHGPDRIGRSAELMGSHMGNRDSLASGKCCILGRAGYVPGRSIGDKSGLVGLAHRDLTANPYMVLFNCASRTIIAWQGFFEEMKHVHRAGSGPQCEEVMVSVT